MSELFHASEPWAELWGTSLWRASWQGAIVLAIAWAIARWCTFLSPRIVCWIWRLACLKLLVALFWIQPVAIPVLPVKPAGAIALETVLPNAKASEPMLAGSQAEVNTQLVSQRGAPQAGIAFGNLLWPLWLACVFYRILRTASEWRLVRRLCRSAEAVSSVGLQQVCRQEAARLAVRREPRLRVSPQAKGPLMAGIWRPLILLPEGAEMTFDARELRLMLAHELTHLKRYDLAWNWLPTAVGWLFFFHPLVWLMTRCWSEAQEAACDELLIQRRVAAPAEYGRLLLKLAARWPLEPRIQLATAGVLGAYRNLERRILAMTRVKPFSFGSFAIAIAILVLTAAPGIVPWRLVARLAQQSVLAGEQLLLTADSGPLPGKIYADVHLETKPPSGNVEKYTGVIAIDPNTGSWQKLGVLGSSLRVSPNGERIAFSQSKPPEKPEQKWRDSEPFVADLKTLATTKIADLGNLPIWSPDGKELLFNVGAMGEERGWHGVPWVIDLATKQTRKLPIPAEDEVDDWTGHGNWMVTVSDRHPPFGSGYQLYVMHPDGTGQRRITEDEGLNCYPRIRPDGKQIVYNHQGGGFDTVWVVDIDGSNRKKIRSSDKDGHDSPHGAHWSPDGKWLAVHIFDWQTDIPGIENPKKKKMRVPGYGNDRIEIIAPDETTRRLLKLEGVSKIDWINSIDWH